MLDEQDRALKDGKSQGFTLQWLVELERQVSGSRVSPLDARCFSWIGKTKYNFNKVGVDGLGFCYSWLFGS